MIQEPVHQWAAIIESCRDENARLREHVKKLEMDLAFEVEGHGFAQDDLHRVRRERRAALAWARTWKQKAKAERTQHVVYERLYSEKFEQLYAFFVELGCDDIYRPYPDMPEGIDGRMPEPSELVRDALERIRGLRTAARLWKAEATRPKWQALEERDALMDELTDAKWMAERALDLGLEECERLRASLDLRTRTMLDINESLVAALERAELAEEESGTLGELAAQLRCLVDALLEDVLEAESEKREYRALAASAMKQGLRECERLRATLAVCMMHEVARTEVSPVRSTFHAYQHACERTASKGGGKDLDPESRLAMCALGLSGEVGEVVEPIKKYLFHGKLLDLDHMREELGDVAWYLAALATTLGLTLEEIAEANIAKLRKRYLETPGQLTTTCVYPCGPGTGRPYQAPAAGDACNRAGACDGSCEPKTPGEKETR